MEVTYNIINNDQTLESYFKNTASPWETARHLDQLMYCLVYYIHKVGELEGFFKVYTEIYDFKCVLENMARNKNR